MAFSEFETKRIEKLVGAFVARRRPAPALRAEVDLAFRLSGQSVEIFEIRPAWRTPERMIESPIAKATFVRTRQVWRVFWRRADLRWHSVPDSPEVPTIEAFIALVDADEYAYFWG